MIVGFKILFSEISRLWGNWVIKQIYKNRVRGWGGDTQRHIEICLYTLYFINIKYTFISSRHELFTKSDHLVSHKKISTISKMQNPPKSHFPQ